MSSVALLIVACNDAYGSVWQHWRCLLLFAAFRRHMISHLIRSVCSKAELKSSSAPFCYSENSETLNRSETWRVIKMFTSQSKSVDFLTVAFGNRYLKMYFQYSHHNMSVLVACLSLLTTAPKSHTLDIMHAGLIQTHDGFELVAMWNC